MVAFRDVRTTHRLRRDWVNFRRDGGLALTAEGPPEAAVVRVPQSTEHAKLLRSRQCPSSTARHDNLQFSRTFQVFLTKWHLYNNIKCLAEPHPGGLGVGSSNLPAPTNEFKYISDACPGLRHFLGTPLPSRLARVGFAAIDANVVTNLLIQSSSSCRPFLARYNCASKQATYNFLGVAHIEKIACGELWTLT
jgi:hypothetical protein